MQYENILQQLNSEFHKLLQKNKELEESLESKEDILQTQVHLIQDKDETIFD